MVIRGMQVDGEAVALADDCWDLFNAGKGEQRLEEIRGPRSALMLGCVVRGA